MSKEVTIEKIYPNTDGRVVEIQYFSQGGVVLWEQMERIICCAGIGQRVLEDDGEVNTLGTMEAVSRFVKRMWTDLSAIPPLYWWLKTEGLFTREMLGGKCPSCCGRGIKDLSLMGGTGVITCHHCNGKGRLDVEWGSHESI